MKEELFDTKSDTVKVLLLQPSSAVTAYESASDEQTARMRDCLQKLLKGRTLLFSLDLSPEMENCNSHTSHYIIGVEGWDQISSPGELSITSSGQSRLIKSQIIYLVTMLHSIQHINIFTLNPGFASSSHIFSLGACDAWHCWLWRSPWRDTGDIVTLSVTLTGDRAGAGAHQSTASAALSPAHTVTGDWWPLVWVSDTLWASPGHVTRREGVTSHHHDHHKSQHSSLSSHHSRWMLQ